MVSEGAVTVSVGASAKPKPWQHLVGERCSRRLAGHPSLPNRWGARRPRRRTMLDRVGMHVEEAEPEQDCPDQER